MGTHGRRACRTLGHLASITLPLHVMCGICTPVPTDPMLLGCQRLFWSCPCGLARLWLRAGRFQPVTLDRVRAEDARLVGG